MDTSRSPLIPQITKDRIAEVLPTLHRSVTVAVVGSTQGGREGVAMALAIAANRPLVRIDLERCQQFLDQPMDLIRELKLSGALPYVINMVASQEDPAARIKVMRLGAALAALPYPVLVGGADRRAIGALLGS